MTRTRMKAAAMRVTLLALPLSAMLLVANGQPRSFFDNFTGDIEIVDSSELSSARIRFEAGARTNWHVHTARQLLLIEEGQGRVQEMGGPVRVLREGESFYTQANVPHWHGADPEQAAVQFSVYSGTLEWQGPVTDKEYLGR